MSDRLYTYPIEKLLSWILADWEQGKIFGIYKELFFEPQENDPFKFRRYGQLLETPVGVAAGPQTQMAQNIILSYLMGARYIELKTVQTLDELDVSKPCIEMYDEGYNCEWSQELKIKDSFNEYLNAWILLHVIKDLLNIGDNEERGFIFNISVGYDLKGILSQNVQWFLDKMQDASEELEERIDKLSALYPRVKELNIPPQISDNVTLSTMHGCPPNEIESIAKYLLQERKFNTTVKLNPTLLGPEELRDILNNKLGYSVIVPDVAFEHDLKFDDAVKIIKNLKTVAKENSVEFGLKLTNTLESLNNTKDLPPSEEMVYMSGRALHPISINLARKLQNKFAGELDISFSAGADAFNVAEILKCNLKPITVCSDLLKPGGYTRLPQYLEELRKAFNSTKSKTIEDFILAGKEEKSLKEAVLENLNSYADRVVKNEKYQKKSFKYESIKTPRELTPYDCISAPCKNTCAISQDVPEYMYYTSIGDFEKAYATIIKTNPLPNVTGMVCDHLCQTKCTRLNYDEPLLIREIKRFVAEGESENFQLSPKPSLGISCAVIGAGPAGLSAAYFLALEGIQVNVYEAFPKAGGMAANAIPSYRINDEPIEKDVENIKKLGVKFFFNHEINKESFEQIRSEHDFVFISVGAPKGKKLNIEGENLPGVYDQISFLNKARLGKAKFAWKNVAIIGGGLSAVDAARTARRIVGQKGTVSVIYRRTKNEMPCGWEEIEEMETEGIDIIELAAPVKIEKENGELKLTCIKMKLGEKDEGGRPRPVAIEGSEFTLSFDAIISSIGQDVVLDFLPDGKIELQKGSNETQHKNVFAGGDVIRGADSLINAIADGKKTADEILRRVERKLNVSIRKVEPKLTKVEFQQKLAKRQYGKPAPALPLEERFSFELVHPVLTEQEAIEEASRCLFCDDVCNICVTVCPNLANYSYDVEPFETSYPVVKIIDSKMQVVEFETFRVEQKHQIINIGDFCNECGNCATFCPTSGAPYKTKPKFFLTKESFDSEPTGFYLTLDSISFKQNGSVKTLKIKDETLIYSDEIAEAEFDAISLAIKNLKLLNPDSVKELNFRIVAEMYFLWSSLHSEPLFKNQ